MNRLDLQAVLPACRRVAETVSTVLLGLMLLGTITRAQESNLSDIYVTFREDVTLRDLARTHLGDANLWQEILRANELGSAREVQAGDRLLIPRTLVSTTTQALEEALTAIQEATDAGARLFAPELINQAIRLRDLALQQRKARSWLEARSSALQAGAAAKNATAVSLDERNVTAEAILSDLIGSVQGRLPEDLVWHPRGLRARLQEAERVRTLSNSFAEIMFRDESRLRLNQNSQAVIERMSVDLLDNRQVANVSLVEGDVYALLGGNRARKAFDLEVEGVDTSFDSRNFWVGREDGVSRFANYDHRELTISSGGEEVALGRNEGTLVRLLAAPTAPRQLLAAPVLVDPADERIIYNNEVELAWNEVTNAVSYWVEIGGDQIYFETIINRWGIESTNVTVDDLEDGTYYWRVAAIDEQNFPGAKSDVRRFSVKNTERPPFLVVTSPSDGEYVRFPLVTVTGESENVATVFVNSVAVEMDEDGLFSSTIALEEGANGINVIAIDERGVQTQIGRSVTFLPDRQAEIVLELGLDEIAPGTYLTAANGITVAGTTSSDSEVAVRSDHSETRTFTNKQGAFRMSVPLKAEREQFDLTVTTASGFATADSFVVVSDASAPRLILEQLPPATTSLEALSFRGTVIGAEVLLLNGERVALDGGSFTEVVELSGGSNRIDLAAIDQAGNRAIASFEIVRDREPPILEGHTFSSRDVESGQTIAIEVRAGDASAVKRAAPFAVTVGTWRYESVLRYRPATATFYGTVVIPREASGRIFLEYVELEDHFGNSRRYASP